jgi:hypothetical protein
MFCCGNDFFYNEKEYSQCCAHCKSSMLINNTRHCDEININDPKFDSNAIYATSKKDETQENQFEILSKTYYNKEREEKEEEKKDDDEKILNVINRADDEIKELDTILENKDSENGMYYKNYRSATCMNCKKNFDMNFNFFKNNFVIFRNIFINF